MQIEVTETILMLQPEAALASMNQLRALGCRIALDDFGTGFSSLGYLHRFPIDRLKIDMSFVRQATEKKNVEIIRSIIALGQAWDWKWWRKDRDHGAARSSALARVTTVKVISSLAGALAQ